MQTATKLHHYTIEDWQQWEGRWELIEGFPVAMSPSLKPVHQYVSLQIASQLDDGLESCEDRCYVLQDVDWIISSDTVVRPDVMVTCDDITNTITKPPEIIFEIISKHTALTDERYKFELYQREGVPYYVLCYPDLKKAKIYRLIEGRYVKQGDVTDETFTFEAKCRLGLNFKKIWFNR